MEKGYRERRIGLRERECVVLLSCGELDGGRRVTMWVSPQDKGEEEVEVAAASIFINYNYEYNSLFPHCAP